MRHADALYEGYTDNPTPGIGDSGYWGEDRELDPDDNYEGDAIAAGPITTRQA